MNNHPYKTAFQNFFTQYVTFNVETNRSEYWHTRLLEIYATVGAFGLFVIAGIIKNEALISVFVGLYWLSYIACIIPNIALRWRRYRDVGSHQAMSLIPSIMNLFFIPMFFTIPTAVIAIIVTIADLSVTVTPNKHDSDELEKKKHTIDYNKSYKSDSMFFGYDEHDDDSDE